MATQQILQKTNQTRPTLVPDPLKLGKKKPSKTHWKPGTNLFFSPERSKRRPERIPKWSAIVKPTHMFPFFYYFFIYFFFEVFFCILMTNSSTVPPSDGNGMRATRAVEFLTLPAHTDRKIRNLFHTPLIFSAPFFSFSLFFFFFLEISFSGGDRPTGRRLRNEWKTILPIFPPKKKNRKKNGRS